jgi:hypothetical protein
MSAVDRDLAEVVNKVVRQTARRWWWADEDDLRQVAWVAALSVREKFDADKSRTGDIKPLARLAAERLLSRYLCQNTSPVSASDGSRYKLVGVIGAPLADALPQRGPSPEQRLDVERWRAKVRIRLRAVVEDEAAFEALLDGDSPTQGTLAAVGKIMNSEELYALLQERLR